MNANEMTWSELTEKQTMAAQGIAVDIRGVNKRYTTQENAEVTALHDINLQIKEHDFICVVGRSGCGKTTLLNMLAGFEKPSDGEIVAQDARSTAPARDAASYSRNHRCILGSPSAKTWNSA